jgi:hypothetical protein
MSTLVDSAPPESTRVLMPSFLGTLVDSAPPLAPPSPHFFPSCPLPPFLAATRVRWAAAQGIAARKISAAAGHGGGRSVSRGRTARRLAGSAQRRHRPQPGPAPSPSPSLAQ